MNFFEHQDAARRQTRILVIGLGLSMSIIVTALYAVAVFVDQLLEPDRVMEGWFRPDILALVLGGFLLVSGGATLVRVAQLRRGGGVSVALSMGARIVHPGTSDPLERRLINVVDEMAIASGTPRPMVFIMDQQQEINAFAAGYTPADAVVAVTRGCLEKLDRDGLQGVIAHEFSHIAHGDMALNIRLIGVAAGLIVLTQVSGFLLRIFLHGGVGSRRNNQAGGAILGVIVIALALWILGSIGILFARLIRAAVSRQREYLADAAAVQYTRYPDGLVSALETLRSGGMRGRLTRTNAEEINHMLFAEGVLQPFAGLLASHPPLDRRIARIRGRRGGTGPAASPAPAAPGDARAIGFAGSAPAPAAGPAPAPAPLPMVPSDAAGPGSVATAAARSGLALLPQEDVPSFDEALLARTHELLPAVGIVLASTLVNDAPLRSQQVARLRELAEAPVVTETLQAYPWLRHLPAPSRLALVELCMSTLHELSDEQRVRLLQQLQTLCYANARLEPFEFALIQAVMQHLKPPTHEPPQGSDPRRSARLVLAYLAVAGHPPGDPKAVGAWLAGLSALHMPGVGEASLPALEEMPARQIADALHVLRHASPVLRQAIREACAEVVRFDGEVTGEERALLRAFDLSL
jgi:Zn-dependent protease with chaperone function